MCILCHTGSSISLALSFQVLVSLVLVLFIGFSLFNSLAVMQLDSILFMCVGLALAWFEIGAVCTAGHKLHQKVSRFFFQTTCAELFTAQTTVIFPIVSHHCVDINLF
jgi:hypothetical protein